jgi:SpoVK/Ycf46/Vps4 family AAA+-type ATPase
MPGDICLEGHVNLRGRIIADMPEREKYVFTENWTTYDPTEFQCEPPRSFMATGAPGCGKSWLLKKQFDDDNKKSETFC